MLQICPIWGQSDPIWTNLTETTELSESFPNNNHKSQPISCLDKCRSTVDTFHYNLGWPCLSALFRKICMPCFLFLFSMMLLLISQSSLNCFLQLEVKIHSMFSHNKLNCFLKSTFKCFLNKTK